MITGPSARFEAKVNSVSEAGKNRPMAMNIGRPRQTTGSSQRISGDSKQEQERERGDADRGPRQRLDRPQAELRQNDPGAQEEGRSKGVEDGCGHEVRLDAFLRGRGLLFPSLFDLSAVPCQSASGVLALRPPVIPGRALARTRNLVASQSRDSGSGAVRRPGMTKNKDLAMATHKLLLLPGDGIGPEVMGEVQRLIDWLNKQGIASFETEQGLVGGSAYDAHKVSISEADMAKATAADAIIFGAVGGPKWDSVPYEVRPEAGLLRLRKDLGLFANLRPAVCYPALADASSLKREAVEGLDIMIVRELTGGVYFGEPKTITDLGNGQKRAIDTQVYDTYEIERIGRVAFDLARKRRNKVTSMEKRNVMKSGVLWNEVMTQVHAREYKDVTLEHQLADSGGMMLVKAPKQFDVIVTDNLFGDMLSDIAAMLTGSLGMLPSASLGEVDAKTRKRRSLFEPVHGSAPDIAGQGLANPIAMISSFGMALRYSFDMGALADKVDAAIAAVLASGLRTADIKSEGTTAASTTQMGEAILKELQKLHA